jgi:hypothetical protein
MNPMNVAAYNALVAWNPKNQYWEGGSPMEKKKLFLKVLDKMITAPLTE